MSSPSSSTSAATSSDAAATATAAVASTSKGSKRSHVELNRSLDAAANHHSAYERKLTHLTVENVVQLMDTKKSVMSSIFTPASRPDLKFCLQFNTMPEPEEKLGFVEVKLYLAADWNRSFNIKHQIGLLNRNNERLFVKEGTETLDKAHSQWICPHWILNKKTILDPKYGLINNSNVIVFCELRLGFNPTHDAQIRVCDDLELLLQSGKLSDVTVVVKGRSFPVHRAILAARSNVFSAMFEVDLLEKREGRTEIEDVEPEVFQQLLNYMYFGNVEIGLLTAADIFEAADKYEVMGLKLLCEQFLAANLEVDCVPDVLQLAEMHQSTELKNACINFLVENNELISQETWNKLQSASVTYQLFREVSQLETKKAKYTESSDTETRACRCNNNTASANLPPTQAPPVPPARESISIRLPLGYVPQDAGGAWQRLGASDQMRRVGIWGPAMWNPPVGAGEGPPRGPAPANNQAPPANRVPAPAHQANVQPSRAPPASAAMAAAAMAASVSNIMMRALDRPGPSGPSNQHQNQARRIARQALQEVANLANPGGAPANQPAAAAAPENRNNPNEGGNGGSGPVNNNRKQ